MKLIIVVASLLAVTLALPAEPSGRDYKNVKIVNLENTVEHDGKYHYSFETDDETKVEQDGELKVIDPEHAGESVKGSFSYKADDGTPISLTYVADENGYQPVGDHLPVAPPIPEAIQRALDYLATAPPPKEEPKA